MNLPVRKLKGPLHTQMDGPKRRQSETAADRPSSDFGATRLDALLPSVPDRAFKGVL